LALALVALPPMLTAKEAGLAPKTGLEVVVEKELSVCCRNRTQTSHNIDQDSPTP